MDVFLMIRRKKLTIFTDAKETTTVLQLKKMIQGITKFAPENQQLSNKDSVEMEDSHQLMEYGITANAAKAQSPGQVNLAVRDENGQFESLDITPYSSPPDLPDVMKVQEPNGSDERLTSR
ncbi:elongin-B-like isoform X2 [Thrips palmi]|uniref:Elongin-B-like isoform X2 n=1 Tax=Thrips palmi TaxID=161013 RepID=A0A6P8ZMK9_THRPL|nr:elongin-B-like isoform X2 [Thrips palmi]